jgi:hypothetical protein
MALIHTGFVTGRIVPFGDGVRISGGKNLLPLIGHSQRGDCLDILARDLSQIDQFGSIKLLYIRCDLPLKVVTGER